jgi:hypothetical protein
MRSSGKHTEEHRLIRCVAPEKTDDRATQTEQRLTSIEGRLDGMQTQLNDLDACMGNIEQLLHRLLGTELLKAALLSSVTLHDTCLMSAFPNTTPAQFRRCEHRLSWLH